MNDAAQSARYSHMKAEADIPPNDMSNKYLISEVQSQNPQRHLLLAIGKRTSPLISDSQNAVLYSATYGEMSLASVQCRAPFPGP